MSDLPLLGLSINHGDLVTLRDFIFDEGRAVEFEDFVFANAWHGDADDLIATCRKAIDGHTGARGIHGPFFGLDLANPDREIRAIIQKRFLEGLSIAEKLGADHMVIHSPFTYWHTLNYVNYPHVRPMLHSSAIDCLEPVLKRAAETGCMVVLENIDDTNPADRVELVAAIGHPNLKVSLDTGHAELAHGRYGAPPVVDFIAAAGKLLGHVHLQDADGYADRHWAPGEGRIPWGPVFAGIAALDADPRLILEVRNRRERLPACVAELERRGWAR